MSTPHNNYISWILIALIQWQKNLLIFVDLVKNCSLSNHLQKVKNASFIKYNNLVNE